MNIHNRTYVRIDNNWFRDERYIHKTSKLAFAVYALILERVGCNSRSYFNISYLTTQLGMNKNNRHMIERIKEALTSLEENDLISFHENIFNDDVISFNELNVNKNTELYVSVLEPTEKYTIIYADEIFTILLSDYGDYLTRISMLSQFCYIISCINKINNICFPSMTNIMECSAIGSYSMLKENLNRLVELEVLVYKNPAVMNNNTSGITQTPNHYARPIHEVELETVVNEKISKSKKRPMSTTTGEMGNLKRSLTLKINNIHNKREAGSITEEDLRSLDELVEEYNQICASTGQKPKFNPNAKPKKTVINMKEFSSVHIYSDNQEMCINHGCDPFDDSTDLTDF